MNVRDRNASAWLLPNDGTRTNHRLRADMARYADEEEVDAVVIGCGAGGGVMAQRLARAGWKVVAFDAGPFWDPDRDWVSDEAGSHHLYWTESRVIGGRDPVPLGSNNSGRGVGGSMVHFAGYAPRFHPSDFRTHSHDGVGADWPISYRDLRPYYEAIEAELPVAGQFWPWGDPHGYPHSPHPVGGDGELFLRGCARTGIEARVGPVAITNGRFGNRPHCIYRGFCLQGCKVNAKASPLITHVPDALAHGAEIRADAMVTRIVLDRAGRADGVVYWRDGRERRQRARLVAVAGYSIETPRLLLNSASPRFPNGLCNDEDLVGRYVMVQGAAQTAGRFDEEVRMYKTPPPGVSSEAFYETNPSKGYKRGFSIQTVAPLPITWAEHVAAEGHWGHVLREYMRDYVHWMSLGVLCEFLPQAQNRVTLADETDRRGERVARFDYTQCDNDRALMKAGQDAMEHILHAAGADDTVTIKRYAHLVGGCRMGADPSAGVVDSDLRAFAVPNLYITDGSVLPTQGSANPALTIMALAARCAAIFDLSNPGVTVRDADQLIDAIEAAAYTIPTAEPESDGTLSWSATTLVAVRARSGSTTGLGFSYATGACVTLIRDLLAGVAVGADAMDVTGTWVAMQRSIRNIGRPGITSMAMAAVDTALWDLKARLLDVPLVQLFGRCRDAAPIYGSGGFTSLSDDELAAQLSGWVHDQRISQVKMKIGSSWGTEPDRDVARVRLARRAIGDKAALFVDANGAYTAKQAVRLAHTFAAEGVSWFEEPVSSDDLVGLAEVRAMVEEDVAAGEYGYDLPYFERMCTARAVDVLQADASRCAGFTEWLRVAAVAAAHGLQISGHCAQSLHAHVACAVPNLRHLEYFADHARIDRLAFDGVLDPTGGCIRPDLTRPGMGLELKDADVIAYRTA